MWKEWENELRFLSKSYKFMKFKEILYHYDEIFLFFQITKIFLYLRFV